MSAIQDRYFRTKDFFEIKLWRLRLETMPRFKAFLYKTLRVLIITISGFQRDNCVIKGAALSSYTLLSIVPVLAIVFAVAKGFNFEESLKVELSTYFAGQEEVMNQIYQYAEQMIANAKGGAIAGVSLVVLFYTVVRLFHNVEEAFNEIWRSKKSRTWIRKFTDYSLLVIISPIFILLSSGINFFLSTQLENLSDSVFLIGYVSPYLFTILDYLPYTIIWILFTLFYLIVPNANVKLSAAALAGVISGTVYLILQTAYFRFQVGVSQYNAIYGSLAALPLLIIWIQLSWTIVLIGAELGSAYQHVDEHQFNTKHFEINPRNRKRLGLYAIYLVIQNFKEGKPPINGRQLSDLMMVPYRFTKNILEELERTALVFKTNAEKNEQSGYVPCRDINDIKISHVLERIENQGVEDMQFEENEMMDKIGERLESFSSEMEKSKTNILVKNI